jgi:hypothetical protein
MSDISNLAIEELHKRVDAAGSRAAAAKELNISPSQLSDVLNNRREISKGMLKKMGYERIVIYVEKQNKPKLIRAIEPTVVTFRRL